MRFEVTVLGSNGALPSDRRHPSAHFFRSEVSDILVDCGEGTQMRLQAAGLGMGRCGLILITHLHGDHYFGLPGLLTSMALNGRTIPLRIVSPPGLWERIAPLLELDRYGLPFDLHFDSVAADKLVAVRELEDVAIFAFPLRHRIQTNGYLIREKQREANMVKEAIERHAIPWQSIAGIKQGADYTDPTGRVIPNHLLTVPPPPPRSYAYCSDTAYFPQLVEWVKGVDLLYHEATFLHEMATEARDRGHSTAREAATTARAAAVGRLIMGHFSARYADTTAHEREARAIFPNSYAVRDLYRYLVPYAGRGEPGSVN
ncbi:RNAse Z [Neolewinella xylanilytica]|uniref:Ribonuclease Z n=1 Tax=Neolewinella xylanilytica TaxID=1514080 RepID=A0A2S6I557_9BACT|nr:ribonuclease Z [Neolewinella xylanilytica]PPK86314.1 RNAse Z [Neolewinella xylanilytica]